MPGSYVIAEEASRLIREFTATVVPDCAPNGAAARDADYDPLRLKPVGDDAQRIEKLLGVPTEVPIEWRLGEYMGANSTNLLTTRALRSANFGEAFDVLLRNQGILTNARTISHRSGSDGELAAVHHATNAHDHIPRFLFHTIVASKLSLFLKEYSGSDRQHRVDHRAGCFGSLMRKFDRELDFIDIEVRESEITFGFSRDVLTTRLADCDDRLRIAFDRELSRKTAEIPVSGGWKDRIKFHIRSNHLSDISIDEICDTFRVQRRTLGRLLRDEGTTFTNILTELRREKALHLVRHTAMPLKRVAGELGFNSDASFCMAFKSWTGTTPMKFRMSAAERPQANDEQPISRLTIAGRAPHAGSLLARWSATPGSTRIAAARPSA
jgi:AraC-like DNA-binding protein